jgi:hypothetical protein
MKIKLTKLEELPNAFHPHNIEVGYEKVGDYFDDPKVGECFWVGPSWSTSTVIEIISIDTFRTLNSIYKWSIIGV